MNIYIVHHDFISFMIWPLCPSQETSVYALCYIVYKSLQDCYYHYGTPANLLFRICCSQKYVIIP